MVCVVCSQDTKVVNSRWQKRSNQVWRRRHCPNCGMVFTTEETIDYGATWRIKNKQNGLEPFLRDKLFLSLHKACQHRPTALTDSKGLTDTIIGKLHAHVANGVIDRRIIIQVTQTALNRFDKAASTYYEANHR